MLAKIENMYLSILRVVILVSATIALIVAAVGLVSSVPSMLRWAGITQPQKALGGSLRQFIDEQKITDTEAAEDSGGSTTETYYILPDLQTAAGILYRYLGGKGSLSERDWRIGLQAAADDFGMEADAYAESVLRLAQELKASKGKPLTEQKTIELVDWNTQQFRSDLEVKRMAEAQEGAEFWVKLAAAGTGFLAFVAIIFIFLFVKIERNLRAPLRSAEPLAEDEYEGA